MTEVDELYLELLKKTLTRYLFPTTCIPYNLDNHPRTLKSILFYPFLKKWLAKHDLILGKNIPFNPKHRARGIDFPHGAETMIGLRRLSHLQRCVTKVIQNNIAGDFIETGVWGGGATIFMRAMLKLHEDKVRKVWVADSFEGLPKPNIVKYPQDANLDLSTRKELAISLDTVKNNFRKYGLLDEQVVFLPGWFENTLPNAPIEKLAILRLDGDMYESTILALNNLYPKVSPGGYIIIDDYWLPMCKAAVNDYREQHKIMSNIKKIDWSSVYWQKI